MKKSLFAALMLVASSAWSHVVFYHMEETYFYEQEFLLVGCDDGYARAYYIPCESTYYGSNWADKTRVELLVQKQMPMKTDQAYQCFGNEILNFFSYSPSLYKKERMELTGEVHDGIFPRIKKDRSCVMDGFV